MFKPTVVMGIYQSTKTGAYYLRDLRTGQMLMNPRYLTLKNARDAQRELEAAAPPDPDVALDADIDALAAELAELGQLVDTSWLIQEPAR